MRHALAAVAVLLCAAFAGASPPEKPAEKPTDKPAAAALLALREGNARYVKGQAACLARDLARRGEVAQGQHPKAVVLGCADSRVPPELVFDQGLGDLFVVREAGNGVDDTTLGSIEYAVEHVGVRLVVVLGHERCGAVQAALAGGEAAAHLPAVLDPIRRLIPAGGTMDVDDLVKANARAVAAAIRSAQPVLAHTEGLEVVAARYDLDSGEVEVLP